MEAIYVKCLEFCLPHSKTIYMCYIISSSIFVVTNSSQPCTNRSSTLFPLLTYLALRMERVCGLESDRSGYEFRLHLLRAMCSHISYCNFLIQFLSVKWLL